MGIILFIIAIILAIVLTPFALLFSFVYMLIQAAKGKFLKSFYRSTNELFFSAAISIDMFGNTFFQHLFNVTLIKQHGLGVHDNGMVYSFKNENLFGDVDETISSVLGKNKLANTLTLTGKGLSWVLDTLDHNHVIKSIE